jgi:hypothetical protein
MIRRQAYLHKGIRMTGEAVPVEYNEISVSRASRGTVRCHFCLAPAPGERLRLGLVRARVCPPCRVARNIPLEESL